jgi:hypothetical protein
VTRCLVVLPDDPKLGEFQKEFAGMLGTLEESPRVEAPVTAGFEEITQLVDDKELVALLDADPTNRIDARAFLKARLFDIWINDWDRHHGQWDWGRRRNDGRWVPVPKDRDEAFVNHDGLLLDLARLAGPRILEFGPRYGKTLGYIYNSRDQDRRFLAELDLAAWNEVATELRTSLSDAAIDAAVAWLPRARTRRWTPAGWRRTSRPAGRRCRVRRRTSTACCRTRWTSTPPVRTRSPRFSASTTARSSCAWRRSAIGRTRISGAASFRTRRARSASS